MGLTDHDPGIARRGPFRTQLGAGRREPGSALGKLICQYPSIAKNSIVLIAHCRSDIPIPGESIPNTADTMLGNGPVCRLQALVIWKYSFILPVLDRVPDNQT